MRARNHPCPCRWLASVLGGRPSSALGAPSCYTIAKRTGSSVPAAEAAAEGAGGAAKKVPHDCTARAWRVITISTLPSMS